MNRLLGDIVIAFTKSLKPSGSTFRYRNSIREHDQSAAMRSKPSTSTGFSFRQSILTLKERTRSSLIQTSNRSPSSVPNQSRSWCHDFAGGSNAASCWRKSTGGCRSDHQLASSNSNSPISARPFTRSDGITSILNCQMAMFMASRNGDTNQELDAGRQTLYPGFKRAASL